MEPSSDDLPVAVICANCGEKFHANMRKSDNPHDTPCSNCGFTGVMPPNEIGEADGPDTVD